MSVELVYMVFVTPFDRAVSYRWPGLPGALSFLPPSLHIFPSPSQVLQVSINSKGSRQDRYKYDTTGWSPQITSLC